MYNIPPTVMIQYSFHCLCILLLCLHSQVSKKCETVLIPHPRFQIISNTFATSSSTIEGFLVSVYNFLCQTRPISAIEKTCDVFTFFFPFLFRISICKWMPKCAAGTIQSKLSYNIQYRVAFVLSRFAPVDWRMAANTLPKASIYTAIEVLDQRCEFVCEV